MSVDLAKKDEMVSEGIFDKIIKNLPSLKSSKRSKKNCQRSKV